MLAYLFGTKVPTLRGYVSYMQPMKIEAMQPVIGAGFSAFSMYLEVYRNVCDLQGSFLKKKSHNELFNL